MVLKHQSDIGRIGAINAEGLTVQVRILDVKETYGRLRWLVTPVAGSGERWVERVSIRDIAQV